MHPTPLSGRFSPINPRFFDIAPPRLGRYLLVCTR